MVQFPQAFPWYHHRKVWFLAGSSEHTKGWGGQARRCLNIVTENSIALSLVSERGWRRLARLSPSGTRAVLSRIPTWTPRKFPMPSAFSWRQSPRRTSAWKRIMLCTYKNVALIYIFRSLSCTLILMIKFEGNLPAQMLPWKLRQIVTQLNICSNRGDGNSVKNKFLISWTYVRVSAWENCCIGATYR